MIVRRYIVNDMKEALVRAKYELGGEAIILSQSTVKVGKWYNPFKTKKLEVTVALREEKKQENELIVESQVEEKVIEKEYTIEDAVNANPIFKSAKRKTQEQLFSYCKLKSREDESLTVEETNELIDIIFKNNCFDKKLSPSRINVLVGPTGVGKTTTIAKIAARESLINKNKVGLITLDTYRIGAVEQLKTYANILGIPCETVSNPREMKEKIEKLSYCDILLIDTLGTSQKNQEKLDDVASYLEEIEDEKNTYLVINISTDTQTTLSILEAYKQLNYDGLILTKFDEVSNFTNLWNIIENNSYPVQYYCFGQEVPDDIQLATMENLMKYSKEINKYA